MVERRLRKNKRNSLWIIFNNGFVFSRLKELCFGERNMPRMERIEAFVSAQHWRCLFRLLSFPKVSLDESTRETISQHRTQLHSIHLTPNFARGIFQLTAIRDAHLECKSMEVSNETTSRKILWSDQQKNFLWLFRVDDIDINLSEVGGRNRITAGRQKRAPIEKNKTSNITLHKVCHKQHNNLIKILAL